MIEKKGAYHIRGENGKPAGSDYQIETEAELSKAASALGRKGRAVNSPAQQQAARDNGKKGGRPKSKYFVVPAPGYYGDRARVCSSHCTLAAAIKAAGIGFVVREGDLTKGGGWLRVYEEIYPVVQTARKGKEV